MPNDYGLAWAENMRDQQEPPESLNDFLLGQAPGWSVKDGPAGNDDELKITEL